MLCLIDIDHFKQVNDRHGHLAGDAVLNSLATAIEEAAPGRGYRLGGDEFALLLEKSAGDVAATADRLERLFTDDAAGAGARARARSAPASPSSPTTPTTCTR